jgi:hypothetical protein
MRIKENLEGKEEDLLCPSHFLGVTFILTHNSGPLCTHSNSIEDPGFGAFFTPGSGSGIIFSGSQISDF